ncbi:MAG: hypothetical protein ABR508_07880 [Candidatus Baltobacteraceae bacterium]
MDANAFGDPATFSLWRELKRFAKTYAASTRPLPSQAECRDWLEEVVDRKLVGERISEEAFRFYSGELAAMIAALRHEPKSAVPFE